MKYDDFIDEQISDIAKPFAEIASKFSDIISYMLFKIKTSAYIDICIEISNDCNLDKEEFASMLHSNIDILTGTRES